jgi:hypothetical protein
MYLMWDNEIVAKQVIENGKMPMMVATTDNVNKLPFDLFKAWKVREVTMIEFINWASDRCFPENRVGAKELLKELGLDRYDGWEIVKKTGGKLETDRFWIQL